MAAQLTEAAALGLLNFEVPLDVPTLDLVVETMYTSHVPAVSWALGARYIVIPMVLVWIYCR